MKRFGFYMLRWQFGGIILAPILWVLLEVISMEYIKAMIVLQFIGACIFFPIDMWIAKQKEKNNGTKNSN